MRCYDAQKLARGRRHCTRIHVRRDLSGLDVEPDALIKRDDKPKRRAVHVQQYSFLAFARFYYNRICSMIEGDYEPFPALVPTTPSAIGSRSETGILPVNAAPAVPSGRRTLQSEERVAMHTDEGGPASALINGPGSRAKLMRQLGRALAPCNLASRAPKVFDYALELRPHYIRAVNSPQARAAYAETARRRAATAALYGLLRAG
jgi:hypothetical protein